MITLFGHSMFSLYNQMIHGKCKHINFLKENITLSGFFFHGLGCCLLIHCLVSLSLPSGKPSGDRPVRLPGQVLHAALQEWEFTEIHNGHQTTGQPLYCQGIFDAITMGEVQMKQY